MALLSTASTHTITSSLPKFTFNIAAPQSQNPIKAHQSNLSFPITVKNPLSLSSPRRLLCSPPKGKYIREDYLVKKYTAKEVEALVRGERTVPLIIDFYATCCGPCILMAQELEMLAVEYESNAMIIKVDTDFEYEFARDMQVRGLPTLYFISPDPSKDAIRTEGLIPIQMMRDIIDNDMSRSNTGQTLLKLILGKKSGYFVVTCKAYRRNISKIFRFQTDGTGRIRLRLIRQDLLVICDG